MELSKTFDPKAAEQRWYGRWLELGYFTADPARPGPVFSMVIPPYNVTGALHLGSALNVTLQDIVVRARRMQGYNTLWVPGTDHAGIATQNVVEREIGKEGTNRHDLGRTAFEKRVWEWKELYGGRILEQLRRLGASADWTREHFTMDADLSRAVLKVFVDLHREGLIYRDRRLINWCPRCETALSDLEVEHKDSDGSLYFIRYPFKQESGHVTVATTRPETMLGDTAVAVHPSDERYQGMAGKTIDLPLIHRRIPLIADESVDREFGTGAVKITPAHDFNDFAIGRRHKLDEISVMDTRAHMNAEAGPFKGMSREACRRAVVDALKSEELLEKIEPHRHALGVCSRCDTVIEPMISTQWFMSMKPLAEKAIAAVRDSRTTFHPKFWENTYFNWLENIHDWCISRQLWWGHRIPAYHCERCANLMVAIERPAKCEKCDGRDLVQEEDVLDTWFSSALWPFSTMGWPDETTDLALYYRPNERKPYEGTTLLVTAFDIIFFWVARMMMIGLKVTKQVPFRDVYITPLVRDKYGKKMTKSRGNVVDPLELMDKYGTDAVRFTLAQLTVQGRDLVLSDERLTASRAFANKIWNAARFVLMNLDGARQPIPQPARDELSLADRWILGRLDEAIAKTREALDSYEFNNMALTLYQFIWHEFCDWYIELAKEPLKAGGAQRDITRWVLVHCFDQMLRLLHPLMPFVSEELWQTLRPYFDEPKLADHLVVAEFPVASGDERLSQEEREAMDHCREATEAINSLRSLLGYHPGQRVNALIRPMIPRPGVMGGTIRSEEDAFEKEFATWKPYANAMAKTETFEVLAGLASRPARMVPSVLEWCEIWVEAPKQFDFDKAMSVLRKKLDDVIVHLDRLNSQDVAKAGNDARIQIQERHSNLVFQSSLLEKQLQSLNEAR